MGVRRAVSAIALLSLALAAIGRAPPRQPNKKKKNEDKEPVTQTLPALKDPPGAISAETAKLVFHVSPLSDKGLLTPQTRDALNALMKSNHGAQIVKLRAFVAGTGDMRRVQTIVSEVFTEKKQPIPALSTIQVGALPTDTTQVVLESVSVDKRSQHPNGLVFLAGQRGVDAPAALAQLDTAAKSAGASGGGMLRVTCFLSSLDGLHAARDAAARAFPSAALDFVQALRASNDHDAVCEGVAERAQPGDPVRLLPGAAVVGTPKIVFSGAQMAFRDQDSDLTLAFQRLQRALEPLGVGYKDVVFCSFYPLTKSVGERVSAIANTFLGVNPRPPETMLLVESLPSLDASMAVEVIAAAKN